MEIVVNLLLDCQTGCRSEFVSVGTRRCNGWLAGRLVGDYWHSQARYIVIIGGGRFGMG